MTAAAFLAWRKKLALTQAQAADALGCGVRSLQQWETGKHPVPKYIALAANAVAAKMKAQA